MDAIEYLIFQVYWCVGIVAGLHNNLSYIALCISLICAVLWFVARWQLGDAFSLTAKAQHQVTRGLYSKIRHPIYVFGMLAFFFLICALQTWYSRLNYVRQEAV